jgi:hypothetical protein
MSNRPSIIDLLASKLQELSCAEPGPLPKEISVLLDKLDHREEVSLTQALNLLLGIRSLNEGDRVSFEPEDYRKGRGKQAGQLKKI